MASRSRYEGVEHGLKLQLGFRKLLFRRRSFDNPRPRVNPRSHALHERRALSIRQIPEIHLAAQMTLIVCVTARTSKRAFPGDFNGKGGAVAG